jgi:hypothetical protein
MPRKRCRVANPHDPSSTPAAQEGSMDGGSAKAKAVAAGAAFTASIEEKAPVAPFV